MKPTVLLFDIDGTLVTTGGAGRKALERAFVTAFGRPDGFSFSLDGMTDRAIVRKGLEAIGEAPTDALIDRILEVYVDGLEAEVLKVPPDRYRVHPGMVAAIDAATERGLAVGLGTGNIRHGARVKLSRVGLFERFSFGGFGDDSELRPELIAAGARRGAAQLGVTLAAARVVVIGDTPKDVAAAQAIGADSVGVATGAYSTEVLLAAGATWAFPTLAEPGALEAVLGIALT